MTYQMDLNLLQNVTFRQFDLIQESFDRKFDLILCRNVMIYFNQDLQNAFLKKIAKNLKKGAFLGLGLKESITWLKESSRFESLKRIEKIYRLRGNGEEN